MRHMKETNRQRNQGKHREEFNLLHHAGAYLVEPVILYVADAIFKTFRTAVCWSLLFLCACFCYVTTRVHVPSPGVNISTGKSTSLV